jgi:hypothetical protein
MKYVITVNGVALDESSSEYKAQNIRVNAEVVNKAFEEVAAVYKEAAPEDDAGGLYRDATQIRAIAKKIVTLSHNIQDIFRITPDNPEDIYKVMQDKLDTGWISALHVLFQESVTPHRMDRMARPPSIADYDIEKSWPTDTAERAVKKLTETVKDATETIAEFIADLRDYNEKIVFSALKSPDELYQGSARNPKIPLLFRAVKNRQTDELFDYLEQHGRTLTKKDCLLTPFPNVSPLIQWIAGQGKLSRVFNVSTWRENPRGLAEVAQYISKKDMEQQLDPSYEQIIAILNKQVLHKKKKPETPSAPR